MGRREDGVASGGHPHWALALVVIGGVLTFAAIFSIWINRQALNTDNWVDTSDRLLENEEVRAQLSELPRRTALCQTST